MKNPDKWLPSKFVRVNGRLRGSRDPAQVSVASRLITDLVAKSYEKYIPIYLSGRLLDLGCGNVPLYEAYKCYISENVCVDWQNSTHDCAYLDYTCDINRPLPFSANEFQTVLMSDVLEHVSNPGALMIEVGRVLANDGILMMNVPFFYSLHEEPHDYFRYTQYGLRYMLDNAGLEIIELHAIGGAPEVIADLFAKLSMKLKPQSLGRKCAEFIQWLTAKALGTKYGSRLSASTSKRFPLGYFMVARKRFVEQ